jgi:hypothetical protein
MSRKRTTSDNEPPTETTAAVAEPPPAETKPEGQSFAEKIKRERRRDPDPFGIASDNVAGVRLFISRLDNQMAIKFGDGSSKDKPPQQVIDRMHEAPGWKWNGGDGIWARKGISRADQIDAERLYQEVRDMLRQEKGIEAGPEVPF